MGDCVYNGCLIFCIDRCWYPLCGPPFPWWHLWPWLANWNINNGELYRKLYYLELRKQKRCQTSQVSFLVKARINKKIAHTACLLTVTVFIAILPLMVVFITASFLPFFRSCTVFRWAEIFLQINSLVNLVLFLHKNKRYRKVALQLFVFSTTEKIESDFDIGRPVTRHRRSFSYFGVEKPAEHKDPLPSRHSLSCLEVIYRRQNTRLRVSQVTPMERRMSLPSFQEDAQLHNALQPIPLTVTVQIEHTPRKKLVKRNSELLDDNGSRKRFLRSKNITSTSPNLKFFFNLEIRAGEKRVELMDRSDFLSFYLSETFYLEKSPEYIVIVQKPWYTNE